MTGRQRTTHEAAEIHALRDTGMASGQISEQLGIPQRTVAAIVAGEGRWGEIIENDPEFKLWKDEVTRKLQTGALELAKKSFIHAEEKLPEASYYQAIVGGSILIDKARLLGNESTEIHEVITRESWDKQTDELVMYYAEIGRRRAAEKVIEAEKTPDSEVKPKDRTS